MIEDLSYSGLTNLIQGSVNEGRGAVIELSERFVDKQKEVEKLEKQLKRMKGDRDQLYGGVYKILQHLQINPPLAILDHPKVRSVEIELTPYQIDKIGLKKVGTNRGLDEFEDIKQVNLSL